MSQESNIRFYDAQTGEPVTHTVKVKHKNDNIEKFRYNAEDERYKKTSIGDIFDKETQQLLPSHAEPVRLLSADRLWEAMSPHGDQQYFPSVTSISNVLSHDGITEWKLHNVVNFYSDFITKFSIDNDLTDALPEEKIDELRKEARRSYDSQEAAERGSRFHTVMEKYALGDDWESYLDFDEIDPCRKIIESIEAEWTKRHGKNYSIRIEESFVNKELGIAGRADRHIDNVVYDYKFSDKKVFGVRGGLLAANWCYPDRALQLANYADGLKIENPILCNIFCNVFTGEVAFYDWPDTERWLYSARLLNMFFYIFKIGKMPDLGENTGIVMHALENWRHAQ